MLVNINLLPQREKKKGSSVILLAISLLLILAGGGWIYFYSQSLQLKLETAQQQLNTAQKLREIEDQKGSHQVSASSVEQLEAIVKWAEQEPVSTVAVLHHLISPLPEHGLFLNYQYSGEGTVNITIQFDTIPEVSAYLHRLEQDPAIAEAKLTTITTMSVYPTIAGAQQTEDLAKFEEEQRKKYVPRQQAQFQLKLNMDKLKEERGGEE